MKDAKGITTRLVRVGWWSVQRNLTTAPRRQAANGGDYESTLAVWLRLRPHAGVLRGSQIIPE
jgi:hypothetical protein